METLIKLPENVVPMPAEQRAKLKGLAQARLQWDALRMSDDEYYSHLDHDVESEKNYRAAAAPAAVLALLLESEGQARRLTELESQLAEAEDIARINLDTSAGHAKRALELAAALAAARQELAEQAGKHKVEVLDILRDMRLPRLPLPPNELPSGEPNWKHDLVCGQNKERQAINDYCRQKAYEYDPQGIGPDPTKPGEWDTRPTAAAPTLVGDETPVPPLKQAGSKFFLNGDPNINPFGPR